MNFNKGDLIRVKSVFIKTVRVLQLRVREIHVLSTMEISCIFYDPMEKDTLFVNPKNPHFKNQTVQTVIWSDEFHKYELIRDSTIKKVLTLL